MRYDCILPSADGHLLLVRDEDDWSLPHVLCEKGWLADAVADIRTLFASRYGHEIAVLRALQWTTSAVTCELELLSTARLERARSLWVDPHDPAVRQLPPEQSAAVKAWREDTGLERQVAPWQRRGWLNEIREWIDGRLHRAGLGDAREITQVKAGWNGSCVLKVETAADVLYFKASPPRVPGEPAVIRALSSNWSRHLPAIVDSDEARCWTLMRKIDGESIKPWQPADLADTARLIARIQIDQAAHVGRWASMGCSDRGLAVLQDRLPRLLVEIPSALCDAGVLNVDERSEIGSFLPGAAAICRSLSEFALPWRSIHHEDFRDGNACRTPAGDIVLIDWNDTVISHPFFTAQRFLWFMPPPAGVFRHVILDSEQDSARRTFRDAYLEPFAGFEPKRRLLEAFELSSLLAPLYDALRFDSWPAADETLRRGLTPEESRNARHLMDHILGVCRSDEATRRVARTTSDCPSTHRSS